LISSKELPLHCKQFSTTAKVNLLVEKSKRLQRFLKDWHKRYWKWKAASETDNPWPCRWQK